MTFICPQCGGRFEGDESCEIRFNTGQFIEVAQTAYYAVHHLSVSAYMLQHNRYSREGWLQTRALLDQFVHHGLTPAMARRQNRLKVDSGHRTFSFTKGPKLPGVEAIAWSMTVADVPLDTAERYCASVRRWAESVLVDSAPLTAAQPR